MRALFRPRQEWLLPYQNPLTRFFEPSFFKEVPQVPGIYQMIAENGSVLYVGKSKNIRSRLRSYYRAKPGEASRKVLRMLKMVRRIEWEVCETETAALLRENALLRTLRPPFNVVNTRPDLYYFIGFENFGSQLRFRLTTRPEQYTEKFFGAFKSRARTREAYTALLRLLWASHCSGKRARFEFPANLTRKKPPYEYHLMLASELSKEEQNDWLQNLQDFLCGRSELLLEKLIVLLLDNTELPKLYYHWIQQDFEILQEFYILGPKRNRSMLELDGKSPDEIIPQERLDDLIAMFREELSLFEEDES